MDNYQLYKTNILLGGQVCWDITLDSDAYDTYVTNFQVSPINHSIPYNYLPDDYEINYTHQYNIKKLYENITGNFYNGHISPNLQHNYPIISDNIINTHENTYELGAQRTKYLTYGKQYEFLCPVWLEYLNDDISFDICISNLQNRIIKKTNIKFTDIKDKKFHNDFVKYFKDYIKYMGIDKGNDNIIKIDLSNKVSFLSGLEITSGNKKVTEFDSLVKNILSRERPLMEFNSMIINSFKLRNMIVGLLFNFRFHFNVEDLFPQYLLKMINWNEFKLSMDVRIGDNVLPCVDTYDNFGFVLRPFCAPKFNDINKLNENVLDYLKDNQCIDLINKNKLYSSIIYWSLADSNDYIFNVYDGFSGYSISDNGSIINHEHLYANTPDIYLEIYSSGLNNLGWCNCMILNNSYSSIPLPQKIQTNKTDNLILNDLIINHQLIYNNLTDIFGDKNNPWINNVKYNLNDSNKPIRIMTCNLYSGDYSSLLYLILEFELLVKDNKNIFECWEIGSKNDKLYCLFYNYEKLNQNPLNMLIFVSANKDKLTFAGLKKCINDSSNNYLKEILSIMNSVIDIPIVRFNNSLIAVKAPSPSLLSLEIEYYKLNNKEKYLLRYDGKIKPTFLSKDLSEELNIFYYKLIISHKDLNKNHIYTKFLPLKYEPIYPSLEYYPIVSGKLNYDEPYKYIEKFEYKWYNMNKFIVMPISFDVELLLDEEIGKYIETDVFEKALFDKIKSMYKLSDEKLDYIKKQYNYNVTNDYIGNEKLKETIKHTYLIKLNLI